MEELLEICWIWIYSTNVSDNIYEIKVLHAQKFGIEGDSPKFYDLMNRLQKHSEWKFPELEWTNHTYYAIAFEWIGKRKELEERVLKLEAEMAAKINENISNTPER